MYKKLYNKRKNTLDKMASLVLAISLVISINGFNSDYSYAETITFADVAETHWAKSSIDFASENGIVNGYYDEYSNIYSFLPENNVSYEEAATMLYRAMVKAGVITNLSEEETQELVLKYDEVLAQNNIADWAKSYISALLDRNIFDENALADFVGEKNIGNPVPREIVAIWTAKSIARDYAAVYYLPYTDVIDITPEASPYIDMLYRHEIMKGSLQLDGSIAFMPKAGVKRCEFAAIANRVYENIMQGYNIEKEAMEYTDVNDLYMAENLLLIITDATGECSVSDLRDTKESIESFVINEPHFVISTFTGGQLDYSNAEETGIIPELHIDFAVAKGSGKIKSIESFNNSTGAIKTVMTVEIEGHDFRYIADDKVEQNKIRKGSTVTFLADGLNIIEIK